MEKSCSRPSLGGSGVSDLHGPRATGGRPGYRHGVLDGSALFRRGPCAPCDPTNTKRRNETGSSGNPDLVSVNLHDFIRRLCLVRLHQDERFHRGDFLGPRLLQLDGPTRLGVSAEFEHFTRKSLGAYVGAHYRCCRVCHGFPEGLSLLTHYCRSINFFLEVFRDQGPVGRTQHGTAQHNL